MNSFLVLRVEPRTQPDRRTLFLVRASDGQTYATYDGWVASLCERAKDTNTRVHAQWLSGWYYRTLRHVKLAPAAVAS